MEHVRHCVRGCLCRTGHVDVHVHLGLAIVVEHGGGGLGQKLREKVEHLPRNGTMSAFSMIRDHHRANHKARHISTLHKAPSLPPQEGQGQHPLANFHITLSQLYANGIC